MNSRPAAVPDTAARDAARISRVERRPLGISISATSMVSARPSNTRFTPSVFSVKSIAKLPSLSLVGFHGTPIHPGLKE
jgi:hypothetical protein